MTALREVQKILDLEDPWQEASKKLKGTTMRVNGILARVLEFSSKTNIIIENPKTGEGQDVKVDTLEVFLPESGIYSDTDGRLMLVVKLPKRQWLKSYHFSFYQTSYLPDKENSSRNKRINVTKLIEDSRTDIAVNNMNEVFYWDKKIGYINNDNQIVCENALFEQEIRDWVRSK